MSEPRDSLALPPPEGSTDIVPADAGALTSASIVVVSGPTAGKLYPLLGPELIIGRGPAAHIRIDEKPVSSSHAKISRSPSGHVLVDLGSTNGTYLNAKALAANQPNELMPGDSIQVAETVLAYLPAGARSPQEQTQYLSKLVPQVAGSTALRLGSSGTLPDAQILAQLLNVQPPEPEKPAPTFEERVEMVKRILRVVRRHWLVLFAGAALGALVGDLAVLLKPPLAEAAVLIRITPSAGHDELRSYDNTNRGFYTAAEQAFINPGLIEKTLRDTGVKNVNKYRIDTTLAKLSFDGVAFMTFEAKFAAKDPEHAVHFLRKHLENYVNTEVSKSIRVVQAEVEFLSSQVKEREEDLNRTEAGLKEFKGKHMERLPEFSGGHVSHREALYARRSDLSARMTKANLELQAARKRLAEASPLLVSRMSDAAPYESALVEARRKVTEARAKGLGDQHPEIVGLLRQQEELTRLAEQARQRAPGEMEVGANPGLIALRNQVADLEVVVKATGAELGELNAQLSRVDDIVGGMPEVEARYAELTRSYAASKQLYASLFEDLKTAQLKLDMERTSARARFDVLVPTASSGIPMRKALIKGASQGAGGGFFLGVIIAVLVELRKRLRPSQTRAIVQVSPLKGIARDS